MRLRLTLTVALLAMILTATSLPMAQEREVGSSVRTLEQARAAAAADTGVGQYYTDLQAARGMALFNRHCAYCHAVDLERQPTIPATRGSALGPRMFSRLSGSIARYPSAYYVFRRMEYMPPNDVQSVTPQQKADILAYLLQKNGLMPGSSELKADYALMKAMPLPAEPGFVHVFNGRDLSGLKVLLGYNCGEPPEGCGKTDPGDTVFVKDGVLTTTGRIHGMLYTSKRYKDFVFRVELRVALPWQDDLDDLIQDQGGVLLFVGSKGPVRVWPECIEIEGEYHDLGTAYTVGRSFKTKNTLDRDARDRALRRVNDWQRLEIASKGGMVKTSLNGVVVSTVEFLEQPTAGHIAFELQGGPVEYRNIRIKEE